MKITIRHKDTTIIIEEATLGTSSRGNTLIRYNDEVANVIDVIKEVTKCVMDMNKPLVE